jgi:hypothetical protein
MLAPVKGNHIAVLTQGRKPKGLCPMLRVSAPKELTSMNSVATLNIKPTLMPMARKKGELDRVAETGHFSYNNLIAVHAKVPLWCNG